MKRRRSGKRKIGQERDWQGQSRGGIALVLVAHEVNFPYRKRNISFTIVAPYYVKD